MYLYYNILVKIYLLFLSYHHSSNVYEMEGGLNNFENIKLGNHLRLPNFRGVFMRDTLPPTPKDKECGIVNLDTSKEVGSHWVAYYKDGTKRIYLDSFGQITPIEVQKYLKTKDEFANDDAVC